MIVYLVGMMGCGKTSMGKKLARQLSYRFIDMDAFIEEQEGYAIKELFSKIGEEAFRELEHHYLKRIAKDKNTVLSTGGGLPCYHRNMELMNETGLCIYLHAEAAFLKSRLINNKAERPLIAHIADEDLETFIEKLLQDREPFYTLSDLRVEAKNLKVSQVKDVLIRKKYNI